MPQSNTLAHVTAGKRLRRRSAPATLNRCRYPSPATATREPAGRANPCTHGRREWRGCRCRRRGRCQTVSALSDDADSSSPPAAHAAHTTGAAGTVHFPAPCDEKRQRARAKVIRQPHASKRSPVVESA
eukprot:6763349-Prymnesium_polylepis.2